MPRGLSQAAQKARAYVQKHPTAMTAEQVAKKFGLNPATVYRADWWKGRNKPVEKQVQQ